MRKRRLLPILFIIVIGFAAFYGLRAGWFGGNRADLPETIADAPSAAGDPAQQLKEGKRPTFDIVRADPDGTVVMAGQSEPGWSVIIESNGVEIGRTTADSFGEWVLDQGASLSKGEHSIDLSAQSPDGGRTMFSNQRLALSLSDPKAGQPLVALTEEGKPTRVLQTPPKAGPDVASAAPSVPSDDNSQNSATPRASANLDPATVTQATTMIGIASVDYEEAGEKSMLFLNGHATPGARIALFADDTALGTVTADATGRWGFVGNRQLKGGRHDMRADVLAPKDKSASADTRERVLARAEVRFDTIPPAAVASVEDGAKPTFEAPAVPAVAPAGTSTATLAAQAGKFKTGVIVVRRGDTLWQIAQRYYGDGKKYTQIFQNNRGQIRDPNWIYPDQRVELPVARQ